MTANDRLARDLARAIGKDKDMTIYEVMDHGPIVASNDELGLLVTANGAYLNVFVGNDGQYEATEAYDIASRLDLRPDVSPFDPLKDVPFWQVVNAAEKLLAEVLAEGEEE